MDVLNLTKITIAWEMFESGIPKAHIASKLGINRETIHLWIKEITEVVVCTFTNAIDTGTVIVHKDVQGPNGEDVTTGTNDVYVTNRQKSGTITVIKDVINSNGQQLIYLPEGVPEIAK